MAVGEGHDRQTVVHDGHVGSPWCVGALLLLLQAEDGWHDERCRRLPLVLDVGASAFTCCMPICCLSVKIDLLSF